MDESKTTAKNSLMYHLSNSKTERRNKTFEVHDAIKLKPLPVLYFYTGREPESYWLWELRIRDPSKTGSCSHIHMLQGLGFSCSFLMFSSIVFSKVPVETKSSLKL